MSAALNTTALESEGPDGLRNLQRALGAVRQAATYPAGVNPESLEDEDHRMAVFVWALTVDAVFWVLQERLCDLDQEVDSG
jgi:hypothetical protein